MQINARQEANSGRHPRSRCDADNPGAHGGGDVDTAADFIKAGSFCLGVGSAIVSKKAVADGGYGLITEYTRRLVDVIREARSTCE